MSTAIANQLTRSVLVDLHTYWFRSCQSSPTSGIPQEAFKAWFMTSKEVDDHCREQYGAAAKSAVELSVSEIRKIAKEPLEEVAAAILLDQIPRNIYRGKDANQAYTKYDPKAVQLAKALLDEGYGTRAKFPQFAHSMFLHLPLMHSETIADHDLSLSHLHRRRDESESTEEGASVDQVIQFEEKHLKVLKQFGRYPSRNEALDRKSTDEEMEHMANGPGW